MIVPTECDSLVTRDFTKQDIPNMDMLLQRFNDIWMDDDLECFKTIREYLSRVITLGIVAVESEIQLTKEHNKKSENGQIVVEETQI